MIFEARSAWRWRLTVIVSACVAILAATAILVTIASVVLTPKLPTLPHPAAQTGSMTTSEPLAGADDPEPSVTRASINHSPGPAAPSSRGLGTAAFVHTAFVLQEEPQSVASLYAHLASLQVVFPDWLSFANADGKIEVKIDPRLAAKLKASGVKVMPRLANTGPGGVWFEDQLRQMFNDKDVTDIFIDNLVGALGTAHADGVNFDIESLHTADGDAYVAWLDTVVDALHARGFTATVDVPMNDEAYDYRSIARIADAVVLMAYDQHFPMSEPGPIAAHDWLQEGIEVALADIPPQKLILGMGTYGYDWAKGKHEAQSLGFDEAIALADRHHARITFDEDELNSHFRYTDAVGVAHVVWLLDAVSAWDEYLQARHAKARGVALWRTGYEDATLWTFYGLSNIDKFDPDSLSQLPLSHNVSLNGLGEILRVPIAAHDGYRDFDYDGKTIGSGRYAALPAAYTVERSGRAVGKQVAFTFDDGPDPRWTPAILAVLRKYGVHGTFFVVGDQGARHPDLIAKEAATGHLVGNHTFSHLNLTTASEQRTSLELNATQRLIESITGRSTLLFRQPYDTETLPTNVHDLDRLAQATTMGYTTVGADIDSSDYTRPGTSRIIANVLEGLARSGGNIVVFHDAGGDRSQTVAAVAALIPLLRSRGYAVVGLDTLMGQPVDRLMPPMSATESLLARGPRVLLWLFNTGGTIVIVVFGITTLISLCRILVLGGLVLRGRSHRQRAIDPGFAPAVNVIIPAFNEAKVICRTLDAVLGSDYTNLRITVVDDGSTDMTGTIVAEYARREARVSLLRQANRGKAMALNYGSGAAREDFVVTLDADTIVLPHTITQLIAPFADPTVDAVCGNVQVGNVKNILTTFQSVEYVTSQNYDRRAFEDLNCIAVVPGATGAWRRATVLSVGGYSDDTLTEDADLTLAVLAHGGRIVYSPLAQSITEAPETVAPLFRQRFRWSFGTLQCFWKHRRQFGRGALGRVALPNMLLFQFVFPLLAPLGDLILLLSLFRGDLRPVAIGYATFLAMDFLAAVVAFRLDRRDLREAWVILIQRFYYRQFLYVVTLAALVSALRGKRRGWNKLERTGTVRFGEALAHAK